MIMRDALLCTIVMLRVMMDGFKHNSEGNDDGGGGYSANENTGSDVISIN